MSITKRLFKYFKEFIFKELIEELISSKELHSIEREIEKRISINLMNDIHEQLRRRIVQEAKKAIAKIYLFENQQLKFRGTGFFISPSYVLTAYHCIDENRLGDNLPAILVGIEFLGKVSAFLEIDKSLSNRELDIAVLKLEVPHVSSCYLPLGLVTTDFQREDVVALGYPAADGKEPKDEAISTYDGKISIVEEKQFETFAVRSHGQSGSPVYHPKTNKVVGIAKEIAREAGYAGWATKFDALFSRWYELKEINETAINFWEDRIRSLQSEVMGKALYVLQTKDKPNQKNEPQQKENNKVTQDEIEYSVLKITHELCNQSQDKLAETAKIIENLSLNGISKELANQAIDKLRRSGEIEYQLPSCYKLTHAGHFRLC